MNDSHKNNSNYFSWTYKFNLALDYSIIHYRQENGKMADCVFIATQDQMNKDPAIAFAKEVTFFV